MPSVVACVACVSLTCGQGTTQPVPRRLVLLAASLMACPGASALVMRGTRPVITHAGLPCEINSDSNSDGHRRVLLRPCEQEDETYFMPHRIEPRTSRPQAGLLLTSPILVLDRDEWLFGCACSGRLPQCVLSVLPSTGHRRCGRRPWLWSSRLRTRSTTWSLEPFVVGVAGPNGEGVTW